MYQLYSFNKVWLSIPTFFSFSFALAQIPPPNKPNAVTHAPAPESSLQVNLPGAYTNNLPLNYVRTREAIGPVSDADYPNADYTAVKEVTQYIDGLGRTFQTVKKQASIGIKDMVYPVVYDKFGKEVVKYLQYTATTSNGNFKTDPFNEQKTFLQNQYPGEQVFYGKTNFEPSPLNRPQKTFAPGNSWAGSEGSSNEHAVQMQYLLNTTEDHVRIWNLGNSSLAFDNTNEVTANIPSTSAEYFANTLYKNIIIDEHNNAVVEYKDKDGLVILKKIQTGDIPGDYSGYTNFLCTYYIYDDFNHLRFVIQPKAVTGLLAAGWQLSADVINELCFRYEYDERSRLVAKKTPGAGWVYMLYDERDRLIYTQDANMRQRAQWHVTLYDALNRPVITGMLNYAGTRQQLKDGLDAIDPGAIGTQVTTGNVPARIENFLVLNTPLNGIQQATNYISLEPGFTTNENFTAEITNGSLGQSFTSQTSVSGNPLLPGYIFTALTITNYDDYSWTAAEYTTQYNTKLQEGANLHKVDMPAYASNQTRGLVTGTRVRVLENPLNLSEGAWLYTVPFYDDRNRVIQSQSNNYKGGIDIVTSLYDFTGKILSNFSVSRNPAAAIDMAVRTNMEYDHAGRLLTTTKSIFSQSADGSAAVTTTTSQTMYDALGQVLSKKLGQQKDDNGSYTSAPIETLDYSYNVRGWLKGINKDYANNTGTHANDRFFGMELNYDWGFASNQYNGNIAGTKWRAKGDGEQRAYGFGYDKVNRLLSGDFSQYNGTAYADNVNNINFDMMMGDGLSAASAYDENGNIKAMKQWGLTVNTSLLIDDLTYNYQANSNKLIGMGEAAPLDAKLGDYKHSTWQTNFHAHNSSFGNDYYYDANGNMIKDKQKGIYAFDGEHVSDGITYNHLNLPYYISVTHDFNNGVGGGSITYIYDAVGNKLEKRVQDGFVNSSFSKNTVTDYLTGAVYENNQLQFFVQEEGRVRPVVTAAGTTSFVFDYFLKDHLGNTRTVLTDQRQIDRYPTATLEGSGNASPVSKEKGYYDITDNYVVDKPTNVSPANLLDYPNDNGTNNPNTFADKDAVSQKMYKLNAATNRAGLGRILKVMAGDKIDILAKSYYHYSGQASNAVFSPQDIISAFLNVAASAGGSLAAQHGATQSALNNIADLTGPLSTYSYNNPVNGGNNVKAGISYIILDDQFRFQAGGFDAVQDNSAGGFKPHFLSDIPIPKNGYIYIYCSNESNIDVFFDNLEVVHTRGPLVEENHYYAFGLEIAGLHSQAIGFGGTENRRKFNGGNELQSKEFSDGTGLTWDDAHFRMYDPQIGRFMQIDAMDGLSQSMSLYAFGNNNPILLNDPLGLLSTKENPQVLQEVVVTAHKKKAASFGGFNWPTYTKEDVKKWDNLRGEYNQLRDNGKMPTAEKFKPYQKAFGLEYQANKEWKTNSVAAVLLIGSPLLATVAPSVFAGSLSSRLAASSADFTIQYALNVGQYGLGKDNLSNINVASIIGNGLAPGSSFTSSLIGTSFATSAAGGYTGIGNTTVGNFGVSVGLGFAGNVLGSKLEGLAEKYVNSGAFFNNFSGNIFGNTVSGASQIIYTAANQ